MIPRGMAGGVGVGVGGRGVGGLRQVIRPGKASRIYCPEKNSVSTPQWTRSFAYKWKLAG